VVENTIESQSLSYNNIQLLSKNKTISPIMCNKWFR